MNREKAMDASDALDPLTAAERWMGEGRDVG